MKLGQQFLSGEQIRERAKELAAKIDEDYKDTQHPLVCICVLRGAAIWYCDVIKHLKTDMRCEFVSVRSYQGTKACEPALIQDTTISKGADVLIVEDIVDTGATKELMTKLFMGRGANSVKMCTMVARKEGAAEYTGFVIDTDKFFVGYGLDYNQQLRNIDGIYELIL
ncbi:MAG: hypoxanthine phosphoribosyltransferase [Clostridiales bacterium]|nr:hypoxanthine phosphoribosyltransferase [Clostridiales bacterium]